MKSFFIKFILFCFIYILFGNFYSFANDEYIFFHWDRCPHCIEAESFFEKYQIVEKYDIKKIETWSNPKWAREFADTIQKLWINQNDIWVPFLLINWNCYVVWGKPIISYFEQVETKKDLNIKPECVALSDKSNLSNQNKSFWSLIWWTIILAAADSVNPCEFAIIVIILTTILTKTWNRKKVFLSWILFSLGLWIVYFAFGMMITTISSSIGWVIIKRIVGIIAIIIWLINIKDTFWYGKFIVSEIPFSRRPKMKKILNWIISPVWAFFAGVIVSVFLAPCSGWPLVAFSGMLGTNSNIQQSMYPRFLLLYTIIFILPMIIITVLISLGYTDSKAVNKFKEENSSIIHFIIGIVMLLLWIYVIYTI